MGALPVLDINIAGKIRKIHKVFCAGYSYPLL